MLLVHSEIYYVPRGDGWEEVLIRNVLHYVPVLHYVQITHTPPMLLAPFLGPNGTRFARAISGPKKVTIFRAHPFQCPS